jgi:hypothetical protein
MVNWSRLVREVRATDNEKGGVKWIRAPNGEPAHGSTNKKTADERSVHPA